MRLRLALSAAFVGLACGSSAFADATIGSLNTAGANTSSGHAYLGNSFVVPTGENGITTASVALHNDSAGVATGVMKIVPYTDNGSEISLGSPLSAYAFSLENGGQHTLSHTFNVPVTEGDTLALVVDWDAPSDSVGPLGGYFSSTPAYSGGTAFFAGANNEPVVFSQYDIAFEVNFAAVPEPTSAILGLGAACLFALRRRRVR